MIKLVNLPEISKKLPTFWPGLGSEPHYHQHGIPDLGEPKKRTPQDALSNKTQTNNF